MSGPDSVAVPGCPALVALTRVRYEELRRRERVLTALEAAGVDNWEWYDDAMAALAEDGE